MRKSYDFSKGKRGPVLGTPGRKTRITIRIDDDVLEWFRKQVHAAGGGNYQTMLNKALRDHVERHDEPLEATLRRVLLEVIPSSARRPRKATGGARKKVARRQSRA
jgi:hypothetical protein